MQNKKIKSIRKTKKDFVIYVDTDSVASDSVIRTDLYGEMKICDLFCELENLFDYTVNSVVDKTGRKFIFPDNLRMPYFDEKNKNVKFGYIEYIERHLVEKNIYNITTVSGKSIEITEDHSLMVYRDEKLIEVNPFEIISTDLLVTIKNDELDYELECIRECNFSGMKKQEMYDVGMVDTPHTFFANDILVHNSIFCSCLPLVKKQSPDIDTENDDEMIPRILEYAKEVQNYINEFYNVMAKRMFNIENHRFDIKQEVIAKTSIWIAKKRYCQYIINEGGVAVDGEEPEIKGLDVVRTSFPVMFRKFMKEFIKDILKKKPKEEIVEKFLNFKKKFNTYPIIEIAKNTSVKFKSKDKNKDYNPKTRQPFNYVKGTPAQAKAALFYNDFLKKFELDKKVEPILHGQKIKWVYVKQNEFGIDSMAMKADDTDPEEIMEFLEKYVDRNAMFEQELKSKLEDFYNVLGWELPSDSFVSINKFFDF